MAIVFDFEHREVVGRFLVPNEFASGGRVVTAIALGADRLAKRYEFRIIGAFDNEIKSWNAVLNFHVRESERASDQRKKSDSHQAAAFSQAAKILRTITEKVRAKGLFRSSEEGNQSTPISEQSPCDAQLNFVARVHHGGSRIAVSRDGKRMLSVSGDCSIKEWNAESGALLHTLRGHTDEVYAATFTPDGTKAISVSADDTIKVWSLTRGGGAGVSGRREKSRKLDEMGRDVPLVAQGWYRAKDSDRPGSYVCVLEVTQDSRKVLAVSKDESISVFNVLSYEEIARLMPSRDSGGRLVHRHRRNVEFHTDPSLVEYFSPRLRITSDGMRALLTSRSGAILVWNIWSGLSKPTEAAQITEEIYGIRDFALSNNNKLILYVTDDRCITAVDGRTGKVLGRSDNIVTRMVKKMMSALLLARYAPAFGGGPGQLLFFTIQMLCMAKIAAVFGFEFSKLLEYSLAIIAAYCIVGTAVLGLMGDDGILCVRFLERLDVGIVVAGRDPSATYYYKAALNVIKEFFGGEDRIRKIRETRGNIIEQASLFLEFVGKILALPIIIPAELASTSGDGIPEYRRLRVQMKASNLLGKIRHLGSYGLRWLFAWLAMFTWLLRDVSMIARKVRRKLFIATCAMFIISYLIVGYTGSLATIVACLVVFCLVPDVLLSYFTRIDVSPSGERAVIVSMTPISYESKFINVKNGKVLYKLTGKSCFLGKDRIVQIKGSQLFILHADTRQVQRTLDIHGMSEDKAVVRTSRSGKWIIIHMDDSIRILDETGAIIHELLGNYCRPVFTPNERYLVLISRKENALKVVDLAGGFSTTSIRPDAELTSCTVTPDGNTVIAADSDGRVYFFKLEFPN